MMPQDYVKFGICALIFCDYHLSDVCSVCLGCLSFPSSWSQVPIFTAGLICAVLYGTEPPLMVMNAVIQSADSSCTQQFFSLAGRT